jgi:DNA-binding transcriptional LysR family regulator
VLNHESACDPPNESKAVPTMDKLRNIETFVRVAQSSSFSRAAVQLRVTASVVTARISQLEEFLGGPLFHRTTRNVQLSELGSLLLSDCSDLIMLGESILGQARTSRAAPAGLLRIHAAPGFVIGRFASFVDSFRRRYPAIRIHLVVSDAVLDPIKDGFDCTLQVSRPGSMDLISRPLFPLNRIFCASPGYLRDSGEPRHPRELLDHPLGLYANLETRDKWKFRNGPDDITLTLSPAFLTNSPHALCDFALNSAAIVSLPTCVASQHIVSGELVWILKKYRIAPLHLRIVFPRTLKKALKLRLFIDMFAEHFPSRPLWDTAMNFPGD